MKLSALSASEITSAPITSLSACLTESGLVFILPNQDKKFWICDRVSYSTSATDRQDDAIISIHLAASGDGFPLFHQQSNGYGVELRLAGDEIEVWEGYRGNPKQTGYSLSEMTTEQALDLALRTGTEFSTSQYARVRAWHSVEGGLMHIQYSSVEYQEA